MSIKRELRRGVVATLIGKYTHVAIQFGIMAVMARLLTPREFGVVAVIMVFVNFINMAGEMGIGPAIVQDKSLDADDIRSLFTFTVLIAVAAAGLFILFAYPLSWFYDNRVYVPLGRVLAGAVFLFTLCVVPKAVLQKEKRFALQAKITVAASVVSGGAGILLAYRGFGIYAVVWRSVANSLLLFLMSLAFSRIGLRPVLRFVVLRRIARYSGFQFAFNLINYFSRNADNLLIGKFMGDAALGFYDKAYSLMAYPVRYLTGVISYAMHPVLSDHQDDKPRVFASYLKIVRALALVGLPISVLCVFSAREIILIMFGDQWVQAIPVFRVLSVTIFIQMVYASSGAVFQSMGRTDLLFLTGAVSTVVILAAVGIGIALGSILAVAYALLAGYCLVFLVVYIVLIRRVFHESLLTFLKSFDLALLTGLAAVIPLIPLHLYTDFNIFLSLGLKAVTALVSCLLLLKITGKWGEVRAYLM